MAIEGYVIDFFKHLKKGAENLEDFNVVYPLWNIMRSETIESLEELLKTLKGVEFSCDVGIASTSAVSAGTIGLTSIGLFASGALSPAGVIVTAGTHALKAGISSAKATEISRARNTASDLVKKDREETKSFVRMGLKFDEIFREMREIIENIRQMTLTYTMDQLMEALGTLPDMRGNNAAAPHRELVQAIRDGADVIAQVDADNVSTILNRYLQNNPDVLRAFRSSAQAGFDLVGLTRLMRVTIIGGTIIGDIGLSHLYVAGSMWSMTQDIKDCIEAIYRLRSGGSVTQDMVIKIIKRLKEEQNHLAEVNDRLQELEKN